MNESEKNQERSRPVLHMSLLKTKSTMVFPFIAVPLAEQVKARIPYGLALRQEIQKIRALLMPRRSKKLVILSNLAKATWWSWVTWGRSPERARFAGNGIQWWSMYVEKPRSLNIWYRSMFESRTESTALGAQVSLAWCSLASRSFYCIPGERWSWSKRNRSWALNATFWLSSAPEDGVLSGW